MPRLRLARVLGVVWGENAPSSTPPATRGLCVGVLRPFAQRRVCPVSGVRFGPTSLGIFPDAPSLQLGLRWPHCLWRDLTAAVRCPGLTHLTLRAVAAPLGPSHSRARPGSPLGLDPRTGPGSAHHWGDSPWGSGPGLRPCLPGAAS